MRTPRKHLTTGIVASVAAAAVLVPAAAAHAAPAPASQPHAAAAQGVLPGAFGAQAGKVDVASAVLDITKKIFNIVNDAIERKQNRSGYVKSLMEGAFYESGQRYNVMVMNDNIRHTANLRGVVYDARVSGIHGRYRVLVFESGQFVNHGDGGWINWAFRGWFDRNGSTVNFRRSW
ncbi:MULTISPECIES: stress protein [Streptomyces]|uniref:Stress response protein YvgO n=1 Tax=Streptomyces sanyensis TaxID=568869 RepID=A0ABP9AZZ2_9ACTN